MTTAGPVSGLEVTGHVTREFNLSHVSEPETRVTIYIRLTFSRKLVVPMIQNKVLVKNCLWILTDAAWLPSVTDCSGWRTTTLGGQESCLISETDWHIEFYA